MINDQTFKFIIDGVFSLRKLSHGHDIIKYVNQKKYLEIDQQNTYELDDYTTYYGFHSIFYSLVFSLSNQNRKFLEFLGNKVYARRFHIEILPNKIYFGIPNEYSGYIYHSELYFNNHKTKQTKEFRGNKWQST